MSEFYEMKIAGLDRKLEKFPVSDKLDIAAFIIFGDVELTEGAINGEFAKVTNTITAKNPDEIPSTEAVVFRGIASIPPFAEIRALIAVFIIRYDTAPEK